MTGLFGWSRRNASFLGLVTLALCVFGLWALPHLASGIYPEVDFPRIVVVAHAGDAPADVTVATVTRPLETALASVPGLHKVRSRTIRGSAELSLEMAPGIDMARALSLVDARANEVKGELPQGAEIETERLTPTAFPVLTFNLTGPLDGATMHDLAETLVKPALARVDGVGLVEVLGGDVREVEVEVDPTRAAGLRLDASRVADAITAADVRETAGHLTDRHRAVTVSSDARADDADALGRLPVAVQGGADVPLSAIADVHPGVADRTAEVSGPGGQTVLISVSRREGASTPQVADGARQATADLAKSLPRGVKLTPVYDQAAVVDEAMVSVRDAILLGIALSVGLLGLLLWDVRAGLVAGAAVPVTLVLTFGAMWCFGQTLNLMSLGGMAVAIGLVVDDAIVVVEAISRHREEGLASADAAEKGVSELFAAVVGTTATTVVVFLPLGLLSGVVGRFFQALAITLASAVVLSMVVALLLVPLAATRLPTRAAREGKGWLASGYGRVLAFALRHRCLVFLAAPVVALVGLLAYTQVETGFLPAMDEGGFVLDYFLPAGTSLADTSAVAAKIEGVLATEKDVASWSRRTGAELGPAAATEANRGDIMVRLVPTSKRDRTAEEVMADLRGQVAEAAPEARTEFIQVLQDVLNDLAGAPHPIEVKIFGPDPAVLAKLAGDVAPRIEGISGIADFYGGVEGESAELRFQIDPVAASRLGLSPADVSRLLQASLRGTTAATMPYHDRLVDVRVRAPDAVRFDPSALAALPLVPGNDAPVTTLSAVARPTPLVAPTELLREDLRPVAILSGEQEGRDLGSIMGDVQAALKGVTMPPGYTLEIGGAYAEQQAAFNDLLQVLALALAAVGLVLVLQFHSIRLAAIVLVTAPLAVVGALVSLWLTGVPLNASSLMGLVLLVGLVVKNGILLLENAQGHVEDEGMSPEDALVHAGERRIRPILLTTACTVFGLLPLALGIGSGADMQRPLAVAVIGGLVVSTGVSLFLLPSLAVGPLRSARPAAA